MIAHPIVVAPASWCLADPGHLLDHEWDGEIILLNTLSGDTHLLGNDASLVYRMLQRGPHTEFELAQEFVGDSDTCDPDDLSALIEATLLEFSRLGLIVCTSVENR